MAIEIVDFPMKMVIFYSYVKLPGVNHLTSALPLVSPAWFLRPYFIGTIPWANGCW